MSVLHERKTILFTSVGNEAIHGFVDDLRRRAPNWVLIGVDVREDAAGRYRCDVHETVPRRDSSAFLPRLQALVAQHAVDLVVPLSTEDQDWFCRPEIHAALAPAAVLTSSQEAVAIANRKAALFAHLAAHPDWLPAHAFVSSAQEARGVVTEFVEEHGAMLLKSDASTGGRGMVCVGRPSADPAPAVGRSFLALDVWSELCAARPATRAAMLPSVFGPGARWPQLANAYLPGEEYSVDVLCDAGVVLASVVRRRDAATGGLATSAQVVDAPDVAERARAIVASVGLSHVVNVQFRRDGEGAPKLMEINPRTPGTIGLSVAAGFNLPLAAFARAMGGDLPLPESPEFGVSCCRYQAMTLHRAGQGEAAARPVPAPSTTVVLWDLDGTLCDLQIAISDVRAWKARLEERFGPARVASGGEGAHWTGGWSPMLPSLEAALEAVGAAEAERRETYANLDLWERSALRGVALHPGAIRAAQRLHTLGVRQAIITNNGPSAAGVGLHAIAEWCDERSPRVAPPSWSRVATRSDAYRAKPSADMLQRALAGQDELALVVVIGDQPGDRAAADALRSESAFEVLSVSAKAGALSSDEATAQRLAAAGLGTLLDG